MGNPFKKVVNKVENAVKKVASNPIASAGIGLLTGGLTGAVVGGVASNQYAKSQKRAELTDQAEQRRQEQQKIREEAEKRRKLLSEAYGNIYGLGRTQSLINTPFRTLLGE